MKVEPCGMLMKQISDVLEKNANNDLRQVGLTQSQLMLMLTISEAADGRLSFKELEKKLKVSQPTVVGIVSRLEQKGFVTAMGDANDKRIRLASLTASGEDKCRRTMNFVKDVEENMLFGMSDAEQEQLRNLLKKVRDNLINE